MSKEFYKFGQHGSAVSTGFADDPDPLASIGDFILELIRKTAAREAGSEDASLRKRIKTLETQIGNYKEIESQAALNRTSLTETRHTLSEVIEEAKASSRKFVEAAALLRAANEELSRLKMVLNTKERELSDLKGNFAQVTSCMRALMTMIEAKRSHVTQRVSAAAPVAKVH